MTTDHSALATAQARAALIEGVRAHARGEVAAARAHYREASRLAPDMADALHYGGIAAAQMGEFAAASRHFSGATVARPAFAETWSNMAGVALALGDVGGAVLAASRARHLNPGDAVAWNNLGQALERRGEPDGAIAAYHHALVVRPGFPEAENNLAQVALKWAEAAMARGADRAAIPRLRLVLAIQPSRTTAANLLVVALDRVGERARAAGDFDHAAACFTAALRLAPGVSETRHHLALTRRDQGRVDEALALWRETFRRDPLAAHARLGLALSLDVATAEGNHAARRHLAAGLAVDPDALDLAHGFAATFARDGDQAMELTWKRRVVTLAPGDPGMWCDLGWAHDRARQFDHALACYDQARALAPDHPFAHWNTALALLARGDLASGWPLYEWRWRLDGARWPSRPEPVWDGGDLDGKSILLLPEQGLGDTLQFARLATRVKALGATVTLACQPPLKRLMASLRGVDQLVTTGSEGVARHDRMTHLLSLPGALGIIEAASIPNEIPYLWADPDDIARWRQRLAAARGFKVGLIWRSASPGAGARSMAAADWAPLTGVPGVSVIGLQKDMPTAERACTAALANFIDVSDEMVDFADTAAAMMNLDLVIAIDTAGLHLAGALGCPAWGVLPHAGEWRWGLGDHAPWYPAMRLFRQPRPGDWTSVVNQLVANLRREATGGRIDGAAR